MKDKHLSDFLGGDFWQINKQMTKTFGIMEALLFAVLYEHRMFLMKKGRIEKDDSFYITQDKIYREIGIHPETQDRHIEIFISRGFLSKEKIGFPSINRYRIDSKKMIGFVNNANKEYLSETDKKILEQVSGTYGEPETRNSRYINNNISNDTEKEVSKETRSSASVDSSDPVYKSAEDLFDYWNVLSKPLPHHIKEKKGKQTKLFKKAIGLLMKEIKRGYTKEEIAAAMDLYHEMLDSPETYQLRANIVGHKVDIARFIYQERSDKDSLPNYNIAKHIDSWFWECVRGKAYLVEKYGKKIDQIDKTSTIDDQYPDVTTTLKRLWRDRGLSSSRPQDENCFRKASIMFVEYIRKNRHKISYFPFGDSPNDPKSIVKYLIEAIELAIEGQEGEINLTPGWLCSATQFDNRLPRFLKYHGMMNEEY